MAPHDLIARLARAALQSRALLSGTTPLTLHRITLLPHQCAAVRWLRARIARYGGALLADPPGLGKTYVVRAGRAQTGGPHLCDH
jgi:SNF2 family DNA or RNA helicase